MRLARKMKLIPLPKGGDAESYPSQLDAAAAVVGVGLLEASLAGSG